jgi:deoxyribodipyrimidine photo-lyase
MDLKQNLQKIGSDLIILRGKPEEKIFEFAKRIEAKAVFASKEVCSEEIIIEQKLGKNLHSFGCKLSLFWQATLLHWEDLPYSIEHLPNIFTEFRKNCEKTVKIRKVFETPTSLQPFILPDLKNTNLQIYQEIQLTDLGFEAISINSKAVLDFKGGENAALLRLDDYFWKKDCLKTYKETRNELIGADYSSKFSAWLALGCISPRKINDEILKYETQRVKNESTYWLFFELLWRDYFRFIAQKYGNKIFKFKGLKGNQHDLDLTNNHILFENWKNGKTGLPFIDANMIELKETGFMSNRGRQNVASYLVKDLRINWQWGAMYFESQLIDYDVCSNWGNWNYVAGVGNDPRENRYFNIASQATKYDSKGEYVKLWLGN